MSSGVAGDVADVSDDPAPAPPVVRRSRALGATAGVLAAAAGLGVGELVAGLGQWRGPVVTVGDDVIDRAPVGVKEFAISTFGHNDKRALVVGIVVLLTAAAAAVGALAVRRRACAVLGTVLVGGVGMAAASAGRTGGPGDVFAAGAATTAACAVLVGLLAMVPGAERGSSVDEAAEDPRAPRFPDRPVGRRRFVGLSLATAGLSAAAVVAGARLRDRGNVVAARAGMLLPRARRPLDPLPEGVTAPVPDGTPFFTPNRDFYRIDTALLVPHVDVATWRLGVDGLVRRPLSFSYDDLLRRDLVEVDCTMVCVSNVVGGDLVGTARWLGVPLRELLEEAGVRPEGTQVLGASVDGFTAGFPTRLALDGRDALLAVGMNGEPLPIVHGYPARLVVPGLYGYVSATKWLERITLTRWDDVDGYWVPRGWAKEGPVKTGSRIDVPRRLRGLPAGITPIAGVAWAPHRGIAKVEVQIDEGPWRRAALADSAGIDTWRQWHLEWRATAGQHRLRVRATDGKGAVQTEAERDIAPDGATGLHTLLVEVV